MSIALYANNLRCSYRLYIEHMSNFYYRVMYLAGWKLINIQVSPICLSIETKKMSIV